MMEHTVVYTESLIVTNTAAYPNVDILTSITDFIEEKKRQLSVTLLCKHTSVKLLSAVLCKATYSEIRIPQTCILYLMMTYIPYLTSYVLLTSYQIVKTRKQVTSFPLKMAETSVNAFV